jgi:zinc/manganese transport system substrate-binding protein
MRLLILLSLFLDTPALAQPAHTPVQAVAAEAVYAGILREVAGDGAAVTSILNSPNADPHAFEAGPAAARALQSADLVVYNGIGYDLWIPRLLGRSRPGRDVIVIADLLHRRPGDNPHLWYDPAAVPALATAAVAALTRADPGGSDGYAARLATLKASLQPLQDRIAALRAAHAGAPVAATESVFGLMADALGLQVKHGRFALAVMNNAEPRPSDVAAFEADLRARHLRALIYNSQTAGPAASRLLAIARASGVPVVGVTESQPEGMTYVSWMLGQLDALDRALSLP